MQGARTPCRHVPFATQEANIPEDHCDGNEDTESTEIGMRVKAKVHKQWDTMKDAWYDPSRDGRVEKQKPVFSIEESQKCSFSTLSLRNALR